MKKLAVLGLVVVSVVMAGCMCMLPDSVSGHGNHGDDVDSHAEEHR